MARPTEKFPPRSAVAGERKSTNRKVRLEAWLDPENYDLLYQLAESEGRKMSNMTNAILSRMRARQ